MGIFGWSYPPGCNGPPEDDETCFVCGGQIDTTCLCTECPECGDTGNPDCFTEHGMIKTREQIEQATRILKEQEEASNALAKWEQDEANRRHELPDDYEMP
jgi:predicted amidophosphoribosyltransferase